MSGGSEPPNSICLGTWCSAKTPELGSQLAAGGWSGSGSLVLPGPQSLAPHSWTAVEVQKALGVGVRTMGLLGKFPLKGPIV